MAKKIFPLPDCTVDFAFQRIGGKYKGRILWYLHGHMILRYGELRRTVEGITAKMLTQTLRELEEDQLIIKTTFHEKGYKADYRNNKYSGNNAYYILGHIHWSMPASRYLFI